MSQCVGASCGRDEAGSESIVGLISRKRDPVADDSEPVKARGGVIKVMAVRQSYVSSIVRVVIQILVACLDSCIVVDRRC